MVQGWIALHHRPCKRSVLRLSCLHSTSFRRFWPSKSSHRCHQALKRAKESVQSWNSLRCISTSSLQGLCTPGGLLEPLPLMKQPPRRRHRRASRSYRRRAQQQRQRLENLSKGTRGQIQRLDRMFARFALHDFCASQNCNGTCLHTPATSHLSVTAVKVLTRKVHSNHTLCGISDSMPRKSPRQLLGSHLQSMASQSSHFLPQKIVGMQEPRAAPLKHEAIH